MVKYEYRELLTYIDNNFDDQNEFKSEYIKLFLNNDTKYIHNIEIIFDNSPENNKAKLEKILLNKDNSTLENIILNKNKNIIIKNEAGTNNINNYSELTIKKEKSANKNEDNNKIKNSVIKYNNRTEKKENEIKDIISTSFEENKNSENIPPTNVINQIKNLDNNISEIKEINDLKNINGINDIKDENIIANEHRENIGKESYDKEFRNKIKINEQPESTDITDKTANDLNDNLKTVSNYLTEQLEKYNDIYKNEDFKPLSLEYILKHKINFSKNDISYVYNLKRKFSPYKKLNDKILKDLLYTLELINSYPDKTKIGYFCYKNMLHKDIEALYSLIEPETLYDDITKINKAENFYKKDNKLRNKYLKSRAKSLEYFINKTVFQKKYGNKPYPRIIFPLQKVFKDDKNNYYYDEYFFESEVELDGCFFIKEKFVLDINEFPFESQYYKPYFCDMNDNIIKSENGYIFLEGDLCLIEIKTHFPYYIQEDLYNNPNEKNFQEQSMIFYKR